MLFFLSKSNKGYLGVEEFNLFCTMAQIDIFENLFFEYNNSINKQNKRLTGTDYADLPKNIREQIDIFSTYTTSVNFTYDISSNTWSYLGSDLYRVENLSLINSIGKKRDIQEVNKRKLNRMINSTHTAPTLTFPVYEKIDTRFRVYPTVPIGASVEMLYIRKPKDPKWTYTTILGNPAYNGTASDLQDIELHPSLFATFMVKILGYAGITLREEQIVAVANSEEVKNFQIKQ